MLLSELKARIDFVYEMNKSSKEYIDKLNVVVPTTNQSGFGGRDMVDVVSAGKGIDWESSCFVIGVDAEIKRKDE